MRLKLEEECSKCKGQLLASQLRKAIAKALKDSRGNTVVLCTFCGMRITKPSLKVTIGKQVDKAASKHISNAGYQEFPTDFVSAADLYKDI